MRYLHDSHQATSQIHCRVENPMNLAWKSGILQVESGNGCEFLLLVHIALWREPGEVPSSFHREIRTRQKGPQLKECLQVVGMSCVRVKGQGEGTVCSQHALLCLGTAAHMAFSQEHWEQWESVGAICSATPSHSHKVKDNVAALTYDFLLLVCVSALMSSFA